MGESGGVSVQQFSPPIPLPEPRRALGVFAHNDGSVNRALTMPPLTIETAILGLRVRCLNH